jgi:NAD(P)-dependent dehydrogenase (short-subunit alcohol dehydrogenase family)
MSNKLANKIAVVTGGSAGIGLGAAKRFAEEGAQVFITGRRQSELDKAVAEIGGNVSAIQGDASKLADLDRIYAMVKEKADRIDVLFANAGTYEFATLGKITEEHFDKIFDTNVRGLLFSVQKALPLSRSLPRRCCPPRRASCATWPTSVVILCSGPVAPIFATRRISPAIRGDRAPDVGPSTG